MRAIHWYRIALLVVPAAWPQTSGDPLQRGLAAVQRGDCTAGVADLQLVLDKDPNALSALNGLAVCEAKSGRYDRAAAHFARITQLQPGAWQGWSNLGAAYLNSHQPERAVEALRKATRLAPDSPNAWFQLGLALSQLKQNADAFSAFDAAQKLAPRDAQATEAWLKTAEALGTEAAECVEKGQFQKARTILNLIRRPLENSASWNNLLGYAQFKLNEPQPALKHLQRALELEPENEDYLLDLGEFLGIHRAREQAVALFEVAVKRMPQSQRARFGLAVSYILTERREEASRLLESLLEVNSRFEPAYRALGECYEDAGNWVGLVELGKKLQAVNPKNPVGWYLVGAGELRMPNQDPDYLEKSIQALRQGLALDPESSRLHFTLAKAYQEQGNDRAAVEELKETIQLEPQHERAHYVLGRLYKKLGEPALSAHELELHSRIKAADRTAQYQALLISSRTP